MDYNGMYENNNYYPCMNNYLNNPRSMNTCPYLNAQYSPMAFAINALGTCPSVDDESLQYINVPGLKFRTVSLDEIRE
jgi:hypothetical protein